MTFPIRIIKQRFLCTKADIACGTVLHMGGSGMHMWNIVQIDDKFYYCDTTRDANTSFKYFGITAANRASWAGEYSADDGTMLSIIIPDKYEIYDSRFETFLYNYIVNKFPTTVVVDMFLTTYVSNSIATTHVETIVLLTKNN